jgi:glutamyl/glutaminyl-tRNA synthetase
MANEEIAESLDKLEKVLLKIPPENFTKENLTKILMPIAESGRDRGKLLWPLRVALSGKKASASPFEIADVLGKEKVMQRITHAKNLFKKGICSENKSLNP